MGTILEIPQCRICGARRSRRFNVAMQIDFEAGWNPRSKAIGGAAEIRCPSLADYAIRHRLI
jgi:hypothetical protein